MRIVRFALGSELSSRWGVVEGSRVFEAVGDPFLPVGLQPGAEVGKLDDVTLLPPVQPGKIVCVGLNYFAHVTERDPNRQVPEEPVLFMKPPSSLIAAGQPIRIANAEHRTDHEAELALVIGKTARQVSEIDALSYVLGYTIGNDVSDRDLQKKDGQWVRAKGFDTYCPLGPWIETSLDISDLAVRSRVNGVIRQDQSTANMIWSPSVLLAFISGVMTLDPGDVILTGTPEGVGPLIPGDTVEIEIEGIGGLSNPVMTAG